MNIREYKYHICGGKARDFSLFGAFPGEGKIKFELKAPRCDGISAAKLKIHSDGLSAVGERHITFALEPESFGYIEDTFSVTVGTDVLKELSEQGLFYYVYEVECFHGKICLGGECVTELTPAAEAGERQLLLYDPAFSTPEFMKKGTMYHVFIDRFFSSGRCEPKPGTVKNDDWDGGIPQYPEYRGAPLKNNEFFGGDLWGIIEKLDYIKSLGVSVLYLSPVFDSASNHKYDTGDYMKVDSMFGGDEALSCLCKKCRENGISVMLDGVFNHTGSDSVYFNRYGNYDSVGAYNSENSSYYDWYNFFEFPDKYECWWGIDILPRVKSDSEGFRKFILGDGGAVQKYMKMGVSGFRLDVADELSDAFLERMRSVVKENDPDGVVLGEVWEDASNKIAYSDRRTYFGGGQLDSVMNYPLRGAVISFIKDGDSWCLRNVTETIYRHYPKCVSDVLMNFLGTHDTERILTVLGDGGSGDRTNAELATLRLTPEKLKSAVKMLRCAYTIIAFMYGIPSVFYGDEAGLEGYHDPFCRRPYPWNNRNMELLDFFREIGKVRNSEKVLKDGFFRVVKADPDVFIFERFSDIETLTVAVTRGKSFDFESERPVKCVFSTDKKAKKKKSSNNFTLFPWSAYVFKG